MVHQNRCRLAECHTRPNNEPRSPLSCSTTWVAIQTERWNLFDVTKVEWNVLSWWYFMDCNTVLDHCMFCFLRSFEVECKYSCVLVRSDRIVFFHVFQRKTYANPSHRRFYSTRFRFLLTSTRAPFKGSGEQANICHECSKYLLRRELLYDSFIIETQTLFNKKTHSNIEEHSRKGQSSVTIIDSSI